MDARITIETIGPKGKRVGRVLNARRDTLDFRDSMFQSTLVEVPVGIPLEQYQHWNIPILDQGREGACTGFGLATVANYLLTVRRVVPDKCPVSPRMLYEMARRYDEWPGEDYDGSSARGAMKGWHKHGLCAEDDWKYTGPKKDNLLTEARTAAALRRPLGAYQRVNHRDLVAMHCALAEVGVLFATAVVHDGWSDIAPHGLIEWPCVLNGRHAFAIVAYDEKGFWIQNSWGTRWGVNGYAQLSYDDWLANGTDVWVARLGAPVVLRSGFSSAVAHSAQAGRSVAYSYADLRPHVISLGNGGRLQPGGDFGTSSKEVKRLVHTSLPAAMAGWPVKHVVLYAHGGLVTERAAVQRLAEYRASMLEANVYPISFVWHSDFWSTLGFLLEDAIRRRRPEGVLDAGKDFMLDRIDETLEVLASPPGRIAWNKLKASASGAMTAGGGALQALEALTLQRQQTPFHLHVIGHSAGAIFHAAVVRWLQAHGQSIDSCTLWAPACSMELFESSYLPAIHDQTIRHFGLFALDQQTEQADHCAHVYNKSLLYLVSRSFESSPPALGHGVPLLGLAEHIQSHAGIKALVDAGRVEVVLAPNTLALKDRMASGAREHGSFDDDKATVLATLSRVLAVDGGSGVHPAAQEPMRFFRSQSSLQSQREAVGRRSASRI